MQFVLKIKRQRFQHQQHKQDVRVSSVIAVEMQVTELKTPVALPKACPVTTATNVGILLEYAVNRDP
jgi:hypothetical protein